MRFERESFNRLFRLLLLPVTILPLRARADTAAAEPYQPTWNSLRNHPVPQWLRDGKFGIYTHWGIYSVPAFGENGTWYAHKVYTDPDSPERKYHEATYGPLEKFGYKDFIPQFTGAKFDPDDWAELFQKAGAKFAGPVAIHHDGFAMWDTQYSEWNAAKMGPHRDVVGELSKAIKAHGMKFLTAFHHAENWFYSPTWDARYDCGAPKFSGLYGFIHPPGTRPTKQFLDRWENEVNEVVNKYDPDMIWFDYGLQLIPDAYKIDCLTHYYNRAAAERKDVVVTYKFHDLPPGVGLLDLELGQQSDLTYEDWITDSTIDDGQGWGYIKGEHFKSTENLVTNLVDRVSKNGYLLLNVGPKPDGTIPEEARERLLQMGAWLKLNGEAIYGTTPWVIAGEGPTKPKFSGGFNEFDLKKYTPEDIRFTCKGDILYAAVLAWPHDKVVIHSMAPKGDAWAGIYPEEIRSITMIGDDKPLAWEITKEGLVITPPRTKPCEYAFVFKIARKRLFH
jgi:alpha-L-fucosidase